MEVSSTVASALGTIRDDAWFIDSCTCFSSSAGGLLDTGAVSVPVCRGCAGQGDLFDD